jgi:nicotinamidase-related amidase
VNGQGVNSGRPERVQARMHPHRALLIVDVQRAFQPPAKFLHKLERYSRRFPCRIFTRYVNPPGSAFRRLLRQKCCGPGTKDIELLIAPGKGDLVLDKVARYGLKPSQIRGLKRRKISCVTVCGLDTDACVLAVMFSLFDEGIECHLKEDMCWSSSGLHAPAVKIIREQFPEPR